MRILLFDGGVKGRWLFAVLLLCGIAWSAAPSATLRGLVVLNQEGGEPVPGVSISADDANQTTTLSNGSFVLEFTKRVPGDKTRIVVARPGWVVVNAIQLEPNLPGSNASPLQIILCKTAEREQWALQFYRLKGLQATDKEFERRLALQNRQGVTPAERELLLRERDQARSQAEELARRLAAKPPAEGGGSYNEALRLFLDGKLDAALDALQEDRLDSEAAAAQKKLDEAAQGFLLRGDILALRFDFDGAGRAYGRAVKVAPGSADAWLQYAYFHQQQNKFAQAREGYGRALGLYRQQGKSADVATTLNNLGNLLSDESRMAEARKAYEESLSIRRTLAHKNPDVYLRDVAATLNNLGVLNRDENRMADARTAFEESLSTYRTLTQKNPDAYLPDVASTLNNLGVLNREENRMAEARKALEEALSIRRTLAQKDPDVYLPYVARTLNNLGNLHREENRMEEARKAYEEALSTYRTLAQKNSDVYLPDVAKTLNNLGALHRSESRLAEARKAYEESLSIRRALAQTNPDAYLPDLATTLNNLGNLLSDENRLAEARKAYEESLSIRRTLAQKNPDVYLPYVASTLNSLGALNRDENRMAEARKNLTEAQDIYRRFSATAPAKYETALRLTESNLASLSK
ncbi:tetratricopeptide repeat protein [Variovorax sp. Sphag1AA]|uniref:tetratricopeptide repeat protein n=1 Tax=Variovorax sp. Sphag1AA TaxID=2587027 RepID=UPI00160C2841|nr:tetratricopeptide repeat protein [Variovorax sp. Sphag1AA]MBB3181160.1 Tfp pilus assembly protein PilF [Variovorax sp. Sphag1AA]